MTTKRLARFSCIASAVALACAAAFAQSQANTGTIEGVVSDPSGKAVAKAQVTVTNLGTNFTRELTTDEEGRFRGLLLPLGPYRVTTKAASFSTSVREGLDLAVGQTISLSIALGISQIEQVVSVSAEAPILESGRVENSTYLDQRSVHDLPNNGRNFLSLVPLTPGVSIVQLKAFAAVASDSDCHGKCLTFRDHRSESQSNVAERPRSPTNSRGKNR